jgi:hypothetical protein
MNPNQIFLILSVFIISFSAGAMPNGTPDSTGNGCIDPSLINPNAACPAIYAPVCGCDGVTYGNACEAINSGVTFYTSGECNPSNVCVDSTLIDPNAMCPLYFAPVCGCNGITYSNECEAKANGVVAYFWGDCSNTINNCIDSNSIDPNAVCPTVYEPVCGCDGNTYDNDCVAIANGVVYYFYGECDGSFGCGVYPYFFYSFDSTGKTVYFMNFSKGATPGGGVNPDGTISNGFPNGNPADSTNSGGISFFWDFGDGNTSTDVNPVHTYADSASGVYTVCLTVYDSINDCSEQYCELLYDYIYTGSCGADFDWEIVYDSINGKDSVVFINNTPDAGDPNVIVSWSFGDGGVANGTVNDSTNTIDPGYNYGEEGDYTVCMSITNLNTGCYDIVCEMVSYRLSSVAKDKKQEQQFTLFPNPAKDKVFITLNTVENSSTLIFTITDLSGKMMHSFEKTNIEKGSHTFEWNTQSVADALYIIHVQSGNASGYKRVSVMR